MKNFKETDLAEESIEIIELLGNQKIWCIQEIGSEMSALVTENYLTRQISFYKIEYTIKGESGSDKSQLKLINLSLKESKS